MYSLAIAAAFAGTAVAMNDPRALEGLRNLQPGLAARQIDELSPDCTISALSLITDVPTPPSELTQFLETYAMTATVNDPSILCDVVTAMPTSLSSAYSSYDAAASSWYSERSSDIEQFASVCASMEGVNDIVTILESYTANDCTGGLPTASGAWMMPNATAPTSGSAESTSGPSSSTSGADVPGESGSASGEQTTSVPEAAAARATGAVAGALAAAGLLGAAVIAI